MIDQTALSTQVYNILKERIVNDQLKPGERVSVEQLAEEFGISRSPVKTAVDQLREEGLIAIAKNRGTFVNTLSERDVMELLQVREMMEGYAATVLRLPIPETAAVRLAQFLQEEERLLSQPLDTAAFLKRNDLNARFHETLLEAADNRHLTKLYHRLNVRLVILRSYRRRPLRDMRAIYQEHQAIYRAALGADNQALHTAVTQHTRRAREAFYSVQHEQRGLDEQGRK